MEFRQRGYVSEHDSHALPRSLADHHPLSPASSSNQIVVVKHENKDFFDPLRAPDDRSGNGANAASFSTEDRTESVPGEESSQVPSKEWSSFKRFLMQRFPVSKMISVSSTPDVIIKSGTGKVLEKSSKTTHLEELDDLQKISAEDTKFITRQEYVSRLHELKDEIKRAWLAEDRVTALKLSVKVVKLLMDTSVLEFYPTLFVLATEVMDMLGDMVWDRIKRKAEFSEDGNFLCSLPENFEASDVCADAKETCYNWFSKVGSIRELLPRIYLELAILPCWRFLLNQHVDSLRRVVMMIRGLGDPLASAYCRLYMAHCARKLPVLDASCLIMCVNDIKVPLMRLLSENETPQGRFMDKKKLLISLMEPSIEYIVKCIFEDTSKQVDDVLIQLGLGRNQVELSGSFHCVSIILHHLLKELPVGVVSSNAVHMLHLIKCSSDGTFDQCLNYRLLGFRLSESRCPVDIINMVLDEVIEVISQYEGLDDYLKVVEAFMDFILQNDMDNYINIILEGLSKRSRNKEIVEDELGSLQSILTKLLSHCKDLEDVFALSHFLEILDVMHGSSRNVVNMNILSIATRGVCIHDSTTVQLLFEISQSLHDGIDFATLKDDDNQQSLRLISRFVQMVDYGAEMERQLLFLVDCRGAFGSISDLKEALVHSSNCLAIKALKHGKAYLPLVKSCIAFSEVTIPSISSQVHQLNLYLETAEVALVSGLVSHLDGLIFSAISCLESVDLTDGWQTPTDVNGMLSAIQKLCSLVVMVPGNPVHGVTKIPKSILSLIYPESWMTTKVKGRIFCAVLLSLATLSQSELPYHACCSEIPGNDSVFFGDPSYAHELVSLTECVLRNLVNLIDQESSKAARGSMALDACNCIASSLKMGHDVSKICWKLIDTARSCINANDKYLQSTIKYLDKRLPTSEAFPFVET